MDIQRVPNSLFLIWSSQGSLIVSIPLALNPIFFGLKTITVQYRDMQSTIDVFQKYRFCEDSYRISHIVKHLASKSVWSASFAVLRSSYLPKPSDFVYSSFCNNVYCACLSKYLPSKPIKALKFSTLPIKSSHHFICPCKLLFFSNILHLYCLCYLFWKNVFKASLKKTESLLI